MGQVSLFGVLFIFLFWGVMIGLVIYFFKKINDITNLLKKIEQNTRREDD